MRRIHNKKSRSFEDSYWSELYKDPSTMDGYGNALEHAIYVRSLLNLDLIDINSVADFGFGLGEMLYEFISLFNPRYVYGLEPSKKAFGIGKNKMIDFFDDRIVTLKNISIETWCINGYKKSKDTDLSICSSVCQYMTDKQIDTFFSILKEKTKYLYFTAPTKGEYQRLARDLEFKDRYAYIRTQKQYRDLIRPHFTIIGNRMLESKSKFNYTNSKFTELIYRF